LPALDAHCGIAPTGGSAR